MTFRFSEIRTDETTIKLLLFEIMGVDFGVKTEEIFEIHDPNTLLNTDIKTCKFYDMIPFRTETVIYHSPRILLVKTEEGVRGVEVEAPNDMITIKRLAIRPIPRLIAEQNVSKAIWGVVINQGKMILIVSLDRLIPEESHASENTNSLTSQ